MRACVFAACLPHHCAYVGHPCAARTTTHWATTALRTPPLNKGVQVPGHRCTTPLAPQPTKPTPLPGRSYKATTVDSGVLGQPSRTELQPHEYDRVFG